jgi:hypothetical protein
MYKSKIDQILATFKDDINVLVTSAYHKGYMDACDDAIKTISNTATGDKSNETNNANNA